MRFAAASLAEFGLEAWTEALLPVLDEIVRSAEGHDDGEFWRSFFRYVPLGGRPRRAVLAGKNPAHARHTRSQEAPLPPSRSDRPFVHSKTTFDPSRTSSFNDERSCEENERSCEENERSSLENKRSSDNDEWTFFRKRRSFRNDERPSLDKEWSPLR
jgi:hypothetical protein